MYSESVHKLNTTKTFKSSFNSLQRYYGNVSLDAITKVSLMEYFQHRIKISSIYRARVDLINFSSAFNMAVADNYLTTNPCTGIKRFKIPEKLPLYFSQAELAKLLANIDNADLRDVAMFAVNTGLREMEIISLTWDQIDLPGRVVILSNQSHVTKSSRVRNVPLNKTAMDVLMQRKGAGDGSLVFTYKGRRIHQNHFSGKFKKYILRSGLNPKYNFHSLRHTFASWLVQAGVSIYEVSKLLGHADIKTTQIYAHLRSDDLRRSVELLE
jgi:site-specific recombinase XerD